MLPDTLTLSGVVYEKTNGDTQSGSLYKEKVPELLGYPRMISVKHTVVNVGSKKADRHLVSIIQPVLRNTGTEVVATGTSDVVNITVTPAPGSDGALALLTAMNLLAGAAVAAISTFTESVLFGAQ